MLHLLLDTSTWLDLAQRRGGRKWALLVQALVRDGELRLLVPDVIVEEFERNRPQVEKLMTTSLADRFKQMRQDLANHGVQDVGEATKVVDALAFQVPLLGAMNARVLDELAALLEAGERLHPSDAERTRVVQRGLDKRAPFHPGSGKNNVADALIVEQYASAAQAADLLRDPHAFITSNSDDFSSRTGDRRHPHADLADIFSSAGSSYGLGISGLEVVLREALDEDIVGELLFELDFQEEPRRMDEILAAEEEFFDRVWYDRSMSHDRHLRDRGDTAALQDLQRVAGPARRKVEERYGADNLGPYSDFDWGMLNGKLSALRWVLGSDWDFLDT